MSEVSRVAKLRPAETVGGETSRENAEVVEAIKALQSQLADLRKIVQAAKSPDDADINPAPRQ